MTVDLKLAVNRATGHASPLPWSDPDLSLLDPHVIPPPPFPEVLPAGWMQWALEAAEAAGCPVDYVALALLAAAGALIGNGRWGQPWPGWAEPPALFTGLIGRPSSGKSPGLDVVTNLLSRLESGRNDDWGERRRAHKRDCAAAKERRSDGRTKSKGRSRPAGRRRTCRRMRKNRNRRNRAVYSRPSRRSKRRRSWCIATRAGYSLSATSWLAGLAAWTSTHEAMATTEHFGCKPMAGGVGRLTG